MRRPEDENDDFAEDTNTTESTGIHSPQLRNLGKKESPAIPPWLEQIEGPGAPKRILLDKEKLLIGRSKSADLCVDSTNVSRNHVLLRRQGDEFTCQDLGSRNGIFLNGVKIHSAVLREGDCLQLGDTEFIFHEGS